jgi:hypothetical protein
MANLRRTMQGFKDFAEKQINKKKKKKAAMEAEKIKIQDEKDMLDVQGAKDGGRMGYKNGSKCKLATKGKGKAYGKNS